VLLSDVSAPEDGRTPVGCGSAALSSFAAVFFPFWSKELLRAAVCIGVETTVDAALRIKTSMSEHYQISDLYGLRQLPVSQAAEIMGVLLRGDCRGGFMAAPPRESGIMLTGAGRGCVAVDWNHDCRPDLVAQLKTTRRRDWS